MLLALLSVFFTEPAPLEMPRADAFLVTEGRSYRLEDRYDSQDLWTSRAVDGRWMDEDGRVFTLSRLSFLPPAADAHATETRRAYSGRQVPIKKKDLKSLRLAISRLTEVELAEKGEPPRQMPRGYDDVDYWQGTNRGEIVCAFLPAKTETWYLATWTLAEGDDFDSCRDAFEDDFLAKEFREYRSAHPPVEVDWQSLPEREQLRTDARHSVSNYASWHVTDSEEFTVLDDLRGHSRFVPALTNDLATMRRRFAEAVPTPLNGSNVLAVARIFADRAEYLAAVDSNVAWTAAYWCPERRELVAHLGDDGDESRLLRTMRHESFHQYLSYATSMIGASPWINEGYAQYFEDESSRDWELPIPLERENLEKLAKALPALMHLDYEGFYSDADDVRRLNYRLAWSIVVFLEDREGARKVRFDPFKDLKSRYYAALLDTQDMHRATDSIFRSEDEQKLFLREWVRFWSGR